MLAGIRRRCNLVRDAVGMLLGMVTLKVAPALAGEPHGRKCDVDENVTEGTVYTLERERRDVKVHTPSAPPLLVQVEEHEQERPRLVLDTAFKIGSRTVQIALSSFAAAGITCSRSACATRRRRGDDMSDFGWCSRAARAVSRLWVAAG